MSRFIFRSFVGFFLLLGGLALAQITPSDDAYTDTALPTTNFGAKPLLGVVSPSQTTYITFDLSSIPSAYTSANIAKASLKLYVNTVTTAGNFNVDYVNGTWAEKTITANLAPALGTTIVASVPVSKSDVKDYIVIDITSAVGAWLSGTQANDGIALVANSPFSATFDSKENTTQSHPPELDIVYTGGGGGTITGVLTGAGSGLTGGGTSGTLNLSLLTGCGSGQVLAWSGSGWGCSAVGVGTITGVTAGTDLTGGGTSGNVTLNLDITKVPQLAVANTFTGNQTVNGNLSATGWVTGAGFNIGSKPFAFGSYPSGNAFLGFAGNVTTTGIYNTATGYLALSQNTTGNSNAASGWKALYANSAGYQNTATGYLALSQNTTGHDNTASGNVALFANTTGYDNTASGSFALYKNTTGNDNTANGTYALVSNTTGSVNTATGSNALNHNTTGSFNTASGFYALLLNTTGQQNTATGYQALQANTTGSYNTASGAGALFSNTTTGHDNTASGYSALYSNITGYYNTASGSNALNHNTTGYQNTASGTYALVSNTTGMNNTATGFYALYSNTDGESNTASGSYALRSNTTGIANTASGGSALINNSGGDFNAASGHGALHDNSTGSYNTASGVSALYSNTTGSYNTALGELADVASGNLTNATAIGAHALVSQSNSLVLGGTGSSAVNVGIGTSSPQYTLDVFGNARITGNLTKGGGSFKIDHPLDPANKYLSHSFVESPDMMNIYNGNVVTDKRGLATIELPEWFEALNRDFRYQLTVIGQFSQAIVVQKVKKNHFTIKTSKPGVEVSWQVTGIRQDAFANAHRIAVEEVKPPQEQGHYLHPELFGAGPEKSVSERAQESSAAATSRPLP